MAIVVLGYHDFGDEKDYPSWMKIRISNFEKQLLALEKIGRFICPSELQNTDLMRRNRLNILLTFDDGFSSNYFLGYPVLKKHDIPALFFISTWNMETGQSFWFDRIIQPIQRHGISYLDLRDCGLKQYRFHGTGGKRWNGIQVLLDDVKRAGSFKDGSIVESVVSRLDSACRSGGVEELRNPPRPLNAEQIKEMRGSGLCHFGSHSHRHVILKKLSDRTLQDELTTSRKILEEVLGETVSHISYPNGDVDYRVQRASQDAGYTHGYITQGGSLNGSYDRMRIPRILVGGYDSTAKVIWKTLKALTK